MAENAFDVRRTTLPKMSLEDGSWLRRQCPCVPDARTFHQYRVGRGNARGENHIDAAIGGALGLCFRSPDHQMLRARSSSLPRDAGQDGGVTDQLLQCPLQFQSAPKADL